MSGELRVQVSELGADTLRQDELVSMLRDELLHLDVDDVRPLRDGSLPTGARGVDATMVGGLVVALGQSAEGLRSVVSTVVAWLSRGRRDTPRSIRMEIDGDSVEISDVSRADQERLLDVFIQRHATEAAPPGEAEEAEDGWTADDRP
jgi:hypothetical protein